MVINIVCPPKSPPHHLLPVVAACSQHQPLAAWGPWGPAAGTPGPPSPGISGPTDTAPITAPSPHPSPPPPTPKGTAGRDMNPFGLIFTVHQHGAGGRKPPPFFPFFFFLGLNLYLGSYLLILLLIPQRLRKGKKPQPPPARDAASAGCSRPERGWGAPRARRACAEAPGRRGFRAQGDTGFPSQVADARFQRLFSLRNPNVRTGGKQARRQRGRGRAGGRAWGSRLR